MEKTIVGLTEKIKILDGVKEKEVVAKIDSGADRSSMDESLVKELKLGPVVKKSMFKSSVGIEYRDIIKAKIKINGRIINGTFSVTDRSHMKYRVLIGNKILKKNFLIDPQK